MIKPKHSIEIEQRVLENLMVIDDHRNSRVQKAILKLTSSDFYNFYNAQIFSMINLCFQKQQPFNFVDILTQIPRDNKELHEAFEWILTNYNMFHINESSLESDIEKLLMLSVSRKQLNVINQLAQSIDTCNEILSLPEIIFDHLTQISNLNHRESKHGISNIEIAEHFYDGLIGEDLKIPTDCNHLNRALNGGIMPKSLIIVAAGASVGKTSFSVFLLDLIARTQPGTQSLFFSIEMDYRHIWMKHIGICARKSFDLLTPEERLEAVAKSLEVPVKIYDSVLCKDIADIDFIITTSRLKAMEKPISVIVVDYLGLIQNKAPFERNDLKQADITSKLRQLANELNCTVIALSQINRGSSSRALDDRCPWPHDAADSSGGHRNSSLWFGVDRPELYQEDPCYRNQFVVKCRKNRFGDIFDLVYEFNSGTFGKIFSNLTKQPYAKINNKEEALFSSISEDFAKRQYVD